MSQNQLIMIRLREQEKDFCPWGTGKRWRRDLNNRQNLKKNLIFN